MNGRDAADYLIIGSGIAGLRAALSLASSGHVVVLTKSSRDAGSTGYAQGGIAAAIGPDDSEDLHAADTIAAGDGLSDEAAVRVLVAEGPSYVRELLTWGAAFDRDPAGAPDLAREGAHAVRRVLHARDATGREIARTLAAQLGRATVDRPVDVRAHSTVVQLIVEGGQVRGVWYLDQTGALRAIRAAATLVATGGAGQVYRETTNPEVACGDGVTLAWLAGARVVDLEFVQFHPTALAVPGVPRFLLSEALRGEGATLVTAAGEPFMTRYHPAGDLAPRDRVARAIVLEAERTGGPVALSLGHLSAPSVRARFPHIADLCAKAGLDLATDPLPVGPAAHYLMGGIATDLVGRTSLPGLFAAGEAAGTGIHGANRLASNSLLEGLVFGGRAAQAMRDWASGPWPDPTPAGQDPPPVAPAPSRPGEASPALEADVAAVRDLMWRNVGVFRDGVGLSAAGRDLDQRWAAIDRDLRSGAPLDADRWRHLSLTVVARLIARAALCREESRGAHARADFAERDDLHWRRRLYDTRDH